MVWDAPYRIAPQAIHLEQIGNNLANTAHHDTDKTNPAQPIIATFQFYLILISWVVSLKLDHSASTDLIRHPIPEKEQDASKSQQHAYDVKRANGAISRPVRKACH
jgi:hypothetical protein